MLKKISNLFNATLIALGLKKENRITPAMVVGGYNKLKIVAACKNTTIVLHQTNRDIIIAVCPWVAALAYLCNISYDNLIHINLNQESSHWFDIEYVNGFMAGIDNSGAVPFDTKRFHQGVLDGHHIDVYLRQYDFPFTANKALYPNPV